MFAAHDVTAAAFGEPALVLNGVAIGLLLFIVAAGLSVVFGMMDVLNLAHGTLFLLGAYIAAAFSQPDGWGWFVTAILVAAAVGACAGGFLSMAARPLVPRGHLVAGLGTFGIAAVAAEIMREVWGNGVRTVNPPAGLQGSWRLFGEKYPTYRLFLIVVGAVLAAVVYLAFSRGRLGALVRAATWDRAMLDALGVRTGVITVGTFAAGAALAVVAGVIGAPLFPAAPGLDLQILILALTVVTIGGLGSVPGALLGALLIGQVQSIGVSMLPGLSSILLFATMAVVLVVRPHGLFSPRREGVR